MVLEVSNKTSWSLVHFFSKLIKTFFSASFGIHLVLLMALETNSESLSCGMVLLSNCFRLRRHEKFTLLNQRRHAVLPKIQGSSEPKTVGGLKIGYVYGMASPLPNGFSLQVPPLPSHMESSLRSLKKTFSKRIIAL